MAKRVIKKVCGNKIHKKIIGNTEYNFHIGRLHDASLSIKKYHYSHSLPARPSIQFVVTCHLGAGGLFGTCGRCVAAILFSIPAARWSEPVLELSRLVRIEEMYILPLTVLVSYGCKLIKQYNVCDLLVSYADYTQGHHGGIYQACSWNYHTKRSSSIDGFMFGDTYIASRTCRHRYGTKSIEKLKKMFPRVNIEPHYDKGKFLYWRALNKQGMKKAERLGLERNDYPKPDR